jgi:signal transduction histidine kinase/ActR/RegA family two-component response regulator
VGCLGSLVGSDFADVNEVERPTTKCSALIAEIDWSRTSLGAYATWPQSLKSFVAMVLEMPTPAIIFWEADQIQLYNDAYAVIMGPRHPKYFGAPYRECWPETYPAIYPWMQRVLAGEFIEVKNTLVAVARHGFTEEAYFTFTFSPLRDDAGAIAGVYQPVVEVTQEVLNERRSEMFRALRAASDAPSAMTDLIAALAVNPKDLPFASFYGADEQGSLRHVAATGIELADAVPQVVADAFASRTAELVPISAVIGEREHIGAWLEPTREAYVLPLTDGSVEHGVLVFGVSPRLHFDETYRELFIAIARQLVNMLDRISRAHAELTLQHQAEAARVELDHERKQLHALFTEAPVAIAVLAGPSYIVELANPLIWSIWGRNSETVRGRPLFDAMPDIAGQGLEMLLDHVRTTGQPYVGTEVLVNMSRTPGGEREERYFNFVYHPLAAASGHVGSVVVVANDVTSHVLARRAAEELAIELDNSRREAERARDEAQRANRAKDEFLAMLGHELRNPLAPIFTALDLMRLRGGEAAKSRETDVIERQARHLAGLVDDLLDVSRITSGKIELKRQLLALDDVLAKAVETASPLFEKRRHELRLDVQHGLLVDGDPTRLVQVFANLLTNAAKYTDPGGVIEVTARRDDGSMLVEVRDNGRGISPEMLPKIFDLFAQESQNLDRAQGGLGLGLAIVKSLVSMHGGQVSARSEGSKRGTTFVVRLPAAAALSQVDGSRAASGWQASLGAEHRILVVDDNEDAATLLGDALTALGYSCAVAHDGPKALELAKRELFDAVVLDIGLPAMDGYEVARHLRALPGWRDVPLVAITGYGQQNDKQRSIEAGFDHHFVKPVDMTALARVLAQSEANPSAEVASANELR